MTNLTVCIPTYNRARFLEECVRALIPQVAPRDIPICISDNGSTDDTSSVVARLRATLYPNIRYSASTANDRIDRNILRVVAMAETRYAWIFGDDDRIAPGGIEAVLTAISSEPAAVYVNRSEWTSDMGRVVRDRTLTIEQDVDLTDGDQLLSEFAAYITFVGALVVDVTKWKAVDPTPYLDTDFVHVGVVHEYFQSGDRAHVIAAPMVECRLGNATWSDRYFDVWFVNWPAALRRLPVRYGTGARTAAIRAMLDGSMPTLLAARANGRYGPSEFSRIVRPLYAPTEWQYGLAILASVVPRSVARVVTRMQRGVRGWLRTRGGATIPPQT